MFLSLFFFVGGGGDGSRTGGRKEKDESKCESTSDKYFFLNSKYLYLFKPKIPLQPKNVCWISTYFLFFYISVWEMDSTVLKYKKKVENLKKNKITQKPIWNQASDLFILFNFFLK